MKQLWHINSALSILKEDDLDFREDLIYIKALYSNISLGTERLVAKGSIPDRLKNYMKVNYMEGSFDFPIKYGYSMVGQTSEGHRVHLMHPHQNEMYVDAEHLYPLPSYVSSKRAGLISNVETCINAIWDAQLKGDEKILILGFGGIGSLLATTLLTYCNINPVVFDINAHKASKALELGFGSIDGGKYDVIFNTTASDKALQYAIDHTNKEGKIIEMSWYGDSSVNLHLGGDFHYNRIQIISSQVSVVSPFGPVVGYRERKDIVCKILAHEAFDSLITKEIHFEDAPLFFDTLRNIPIDDLGIIIKYD